MNRVDELRRIRAEIGRLTDDEQRLSVPIVMNMGMIYNLYQTFCLTLRRIDPSATPTDTNSRKKFLYAVLYIFSPSTIVGKVMRHKLRESVSAVMGYTPTGVSRDYKTAIFYFATYKKFRDDVNAIIHDMLETLDKTEEI